MPLFDWLFGGTKTAKATPTASQPSQIEQARLTTVPANPGAARSPEENLNRWRASGKARAWVEARNGHWNHEDWLRLLEELRTSEFWPLDAEAIGRTLEELKQARKAVANGKGAS